MPLDHTGQILFVVVMAILFLLIIPVVQSRTGKSLNQLFFGGKRNPRKTRNGMLDASAIQEPEKPEREPRINNGTRGEWTDFVAKLLRYANKNGMALVVPGSLRSGGKTAQLLALLVTPNRIIGLQCMGFGGALTPGEDGQKWNQHANYQDIPFDDPLASAAVQRQIAQDALKHNNIHAQVDVYTVFTNARVSFPQGKPAGLFTRSEFFDFLDNTKALRSGSLDPRALSLKLADMAGIHNKKKK